MTQEAVPDAIVNGRKVAIALLLLAMTGAAALAIFLIAWWMTRPAVVY